MRSTGRLWGEIRRALLAPAPSSSPALWWPEAPPTAPLHGLLGIVPNWMHLSGDYSKGARPESSARTGPSYAQAPGRLDTSHGGIRQTKAQSRAARTAHLGGTNGTGWGGDGYGWRNGRQCLGIGGGQGQPRMEADGFGSKLPKQPKSRHECRSHKTAGGHSASPHTRPTERRRLQAEACGTRNAKGSRGLTRMDADGPPHEGRASIRQQAAEATKRGWFREQAPEMPKCWEGGGGC